MCTTQTRNLQSALGSGALPDPRFGQPDFRELRCAQIGFVRAEEFVELGGRDLRSGKHRVRLSGVVDLVLEERCAGGGSPRASGAQKVRSRRSAACWATDSVAQVSNGSSGS